MFSTRRALGFLALTTATSAGSSNISFATGVSVNATVACGAVSKGAVTGSLSHTGSQLDTGSGAGAGAGSQSDTGSGAGAGSQSDTGSGAGAGSQSGTGTETRGASQALPVSITETTLCSSKGDIVFCAGMETGKGFDGVKDGTGKLGTGKGAGAGVGAGALGK